jgi:hypothetical protein
VRRSDEIASAGVALLLLLLGGAVFTGTALVWSLTTDAPAAEASE